jgi:hypothetical protein
MNRIDIKSLSIQFAEHCAWRAVYVFVGGRQIFRLGVDPSASRGPHLFGMVAGREFRLQLPTVRWTYPMGRVRTWAYSACQRFYFALDGRNA